MEPRRDESLVLVKLSSSGRPCLCLVPSGMGARRLRLGVPLVVDTEIGQSFGSVAGPVVVETGAAATRRSEPVLRVLRVATEDDIAIRRRQQFREREAFRVALLKIRERGLAMKLTRVEQLYDGSRLVFYFTSEGRVDFRELVRELAAEFHSRIEMRQIGARDEARLLGGYGSCGRLLCCSAWLQSFEPVSIKMAKQQELSLNPSKLSGLCGRLKCCLRFELPENGLRRRGDVHDEALADGNGGKP